MIHQINLLKPNIELMVNRYVSKFIKHHLASADHASLIGELTDYNLINTDKDCGGYCDYTNKIIALNEIGEDPYKTIFHEIGHCIQAELEEFEKQTKLISDEIKMEREAEFIAYNLYIKCLPDRNISMINFNAYTTENGWKFLIDWHGNDMQNDIEHYFKDYVR